MTNPLADLLLRFSRTEPERLCIRTGAGDTWTFGDLDTRSARLAHTLVARGIRPGDRLAVQTAKSATLLALHVACLRAGAVYLPMNDAYTERELGDLIDDAEPTLVVRDGPPVHGTPQVTLAQLVADSQGESSEFADVARTPDDPAAILYTSGTTGKPKGAVMSHSNLDFSARALVEAWGFTASDVLLHILPLFHTHGLFVAAYCSVASGGSMVLLDGFSPEGVIRELPGCSVLMGVPTHYTRLLADPGFTADVAAGVRLFTCGSAPLLVSTHHDFRARTGQSILERYGMTETSILTSNPLHGERRPGTVGTALPGVDVRVVGGDPGAIEVRGPNVFGGYWRRPELQSTEFTPDGWFATGDLGSLDDDGYLEIVSRSKDLIISGGLNVYPKEVELVLDGLPGVSESAVIGVPDPDFGEAVVAAVTSHDGIRLDPQNLRELARVQLAAFKVPKRIHVLSELPRNAMGKVEKARLRSELDDEPRYLP